MLFQLEVQYRLLKIPVQQFLCLGNIRLDLLLCLFPGQPLARTFQSHILERWLSVK